MGNKKNIGVCLLNDAFPPAIDGVGNVVFNYACKIFLCETYAYGSTVDKRTWFFRKFTYHPK